MKKIYAALIAFLFAIVLTFSNAVPAQATGYWTGNQQVSDSAGTGTLTVTFQRDWFHNVGFKLIAVKIASDGGGIANQGIDGKGLSCWNDDNTVKWSVGAAGSSLDKGQTKTWSPNQTWSGSSTLTCGWFYADVFVPGGNQNQCAKVKVFDTTDVEGHCSA